MAYNRLTAGRLKQQRRTLQDKVIHESNMTVLTNGSGVTLSPGDVVVIDPTVDRTVTLATSQASASPLVVVAGGNAGDEVKCAYVGYGEIDIMCDGGEVAPGAAVGTSATPRYGNTLNNPSIQTMLGIALTSKADAAVGTVTIIILSGGGDIVLPSAHYYRYSTIVVAANNSTDINKTGADYVCDGTADEAEIIQAITDAASAGGGRVLLLEGSYNIVAPIRPMSNVTIEGQGDGTIILSRATVFSTNVDLSNAHIKNLKIQFDTNINSGRYGFTISAGACTDCSIENVYFYYGYYGIVPSSNTYRLRVVGCTFYYTRGAIGLFPSGRGWVVDDVLIQGCTFYYNTSSAIYIQGNDSWSDADEMDARNILISHNKFIGAYNFPTYATPFYYGCYFDYVYNVTVVGNDFHGISGCISLESGLISVITGNSFHDTYNYAILIQADSYILAQNDVTITGNTFDHAASHVIAIEGLWVGTEEGRDEYDSETNVVISSNVFDLCENSIGIYTTTKVEIIGNIIRNDYSIPIEIFDTWEFLIESNLLEDCVCGIQISDIADSYKIDGNYLINITGTHGIWLMGAPHGVVINNTLIGIGASSANTYDGIHIETYNAVDSNDTFVQGNFMRTLAGGAATMRYGVNIAEVGCQDIIVAWNDMRGSAATAECNDAGSNNIFLRYLGNTVGVGVGGMLNYTEIEPDGTLEFIGDATVWQDFSIGAVSLGRAASAPDLESFNSSNILLPCFNGVGTMEQLFGSIELNHMYKEGTDISFHIHWMPTTADAGNVVWQLEYIWKNPEATAGGAVSATPITVAAGGTAWANKLSAFADISGAGKTIGSQFNFRLFRDPTHGSDSYEYDAMIETVGLHVECDTVGSRLISTK